MSIILNSSQWILNSGQIPKCIVYKQCVDTGFGRMFQYRMCDWKQGKYVGEMYARPVTENMFSCYYPKMHSYESFKIESLVMDEKRQGYGKKFINLAKKESQKYGCEGRVHLLASQAYSPKNPPHLFYRKIGFTSRFTKKVKYFDQCIKKGVQVDWQEAFNLPMYLPEYEPPKVSKIKVYMRFLRRFFK